MIGENKTSAGAETGIKIAEGLIGMFNLMYNLDTVKRVVTPLIRRLQLFECEVVAKIKTRKKGG